MAQLYYAHSKLYFPFHSNRVTRYYMPQPLRLKIDGQRKGRYMLAFGEFDRSESHEWQEVTLQIGKVASSRWRLINPQPI